MVAGRAKPVRARSSDQLPALPSLANNLQPVALVSVDADKEKLHVQRFGGQNRKSSNPVPPQRQSSIKARARSNSTGGSRYGTSLIYCIMIFFFSQA